MHQLYETMDRQAVPQLRSLAAHGELHRALTSLSVPESRRLRAAACAITYPLLWERHTRPLELRRRHWGCAKGLRHLSPDCADGFGQDLEAVVRALLSYRPPIVNLEGWLTARMPNAIKDGHRDRRGEMGAQKRVRVPAWLDARLGHDPWLVELARSILEWVGLRLTAGPDEWPLDRWALERDRRVEGRYGVTGPAVIRRDVETVLTQMRTGNPGWYEAYVNAPLGRKWAPVAGAAEPDEARPYQPFGQAEREESGLRVRAAVALRAIAARTLAGDDPMTAIPEIAMRIFAGHRSVCDELDHPPHGDGAGADLRLAAIFADSLRRADFVAEVLRIVQA